MAKVYTSCGTEITIDDADLELVQQYNWFMIQTYPATSIRKKNGKKIRLLMHALLCPAAPGEESYVIDHIDGNKLNHRRANLRRITRAQKSWQLKSVLVGSYKGVLKIKGRGFKASYTKNNVRTVIGFFNDEKLAAYAYDVVIRKEYGDSAYVNFLGKEECKTLNTRKVLKKLLAWKFVSLDDLKELHIPF